MIGKTLANRYLIEEKIGEGGMAVVYKARDNFLNRWVTVKVLRDQFAMDESFVRRFRREAQAAASLSHPNVVSIFDVGEEDNTYYIVMEFIDGQSLKELITRKEKLPFQEAVEIAREICEALVNAHQNKIIHRDIKPHNILITGEGRVKVTDFGIARAVTASTVTYNNKSIMGSVHYFAPEQARGDMVGEKADIYSLGIVLYEMVTGIVPFSGDSPISIALQHLQEDIKSPASINAEVPYFLEKIIIKAVQKDPDLRYGDAREMLSDLKQWLAENQEGRNSLQKPVVTNRGRSYFLDLEEEDGEDGEEDTREKRNKKVKKGSKKSARAQERLSWLAAGLLAFVLFIAAVGFSFNWLRSFLQVSEIQVPEVVNKSVQEATSLLQGAGLEAVITGETYHDDIQGGHVISQDPGAGRRVKQGREIQLTVSKGLATIEVPLVEGMTLLEARLILQESELVLDNEEEFSTEIPAGRIISQDPGEGFKLNKGDVVMVVVSKGSQPVRLRNLVGWTLGEAQEWIELYNLELKHVEKRHHPQVEKDRVIEQFPEPGEMILALDPVELVISLGPEEEETVEEEEPVEEEEEAEEVHQGYRITINPSVSGISYGEVVRVDIEDKLGVRTVFEGPYEGNVIPVEGYGSGVVSFLRKGPEGFEMVEFIRFP